MYGDLKNAEMISKKYYAKSKKYLENYFQNLIILFIIFRFHLL